MDQQDEAFMIEALMLAQRGIELGDGGPFGAVLVLDGRIIGRGWNQVVKLNDPTAHAEMLAIRDACAHAKRFHLPGSVLYTSCEPCPMCLSAAYWTHIERLVYAAGAEDAAAIGFSDSEIKAELDKSTDDRVIITRQLFRERSLALFAQWRESDKRVDY
ncbi:MAG: tRNA-specific adenosine deaminase [gamma proteobacterium symbiont of Ctena orbiculata]|nr:nucleoside deaminase [Candidatus Thiodiazotropha taylori]MBT3036497.1 nucleoside deaminase [Candidatus Thiodiazotropha taylori]PVV13174.1 MAG: tRNA-specific adenosine deaminase [gamma proteobacterium symbiont of Ctena orbiculata]PVV13698.1 MAG: tRNA-specific adenosine deaminase [gamma proteobacterium symbiont of Ctena orbiculata]PVV21801.1 MAG: tRNA-specific adenosine deaminase [gamma proteobacterium symbiont of Ctena orbiculata]